MAKQADETRILNVTDDPSSTRELEQMLGGDGDVRTMFADTGNAVSRTFEESHVDMVMIHVDSADLGLLETAIRHAREQEHFVPVVALVDSEDSRSALAAANLGVEGLVVHANPRQLKRIARNQVESLKARRDARQALRNLEDIEARYTLLLDSSSEAIAYLHEGLHIYANPAYLELFGFVSFEELEGLSMLDLFTPSRKDQDLKKVLKALARDDIPRDALLLNAHRQDGSEFKASVAFSPARYGGEYCAQMLVNEEIAQSDPKLEEELRKLKTRDVLTGLLNSGSFIEQLTSGLEQREDTSGFSVLVFSLDKTNELTAKVGVGASDALIKEAGNLFREILGEERPIARFREHRFGLLADINSREEAEKLATSIVENCNGKIIEVRETSLTITASVGLAVAGSEVPEPESLMEHADAALSEAMQAGGNSFVRYRPRVSAEGEEDDTVWTERLRHALDHDEFSLVSSAITCMEDDSFLINDMETRLRAEDSDEVLLPSSYMPVAARTGMAARIDLNMLKHLNQLLTERSGDAETQWLIPLSLETVMHPKANQVIENFLKKMSIEPNQIIWGLNEPDVRDKLRQVQTFIERFSAHGCQFALCNVDTTAAIEPLLQNLDMNFLRLVPEAVKDLGNNDKLRDQLSTLSTHAREHEVRIIAPKVEHTGDLATLWQFGITLVQGDFVRETASA